MQNHVRSGISQPLLGCEFFFNFLIKFVRFLESILILLKIKMKKDMRISHVSLFDSLFDKKKKYSMKPINNAHLIGRRGGE